MRPPAPSLLWSVWVTLALVALSTLSVINPVNVQDVTRIALTRQIAEHGSLNIDRYEHATTDKAFRDGHWYSDKAPGLSVLAIPFVEGVRGIDALAHRTGKLPYWKEVAHVWLERVATAGLGLLLATFTLYRLAERRYPGYGPPVALTYALGTLAGPLGPTSFEHDLGAGLSFAAFALLLGDDRVGLRAAAAGALVGAAVFCEYLIGLIAPALAVLATVRYGRRGLLLYVAGGMPFALGLGAYNWAAFGSPLHLSYKYVANAYTARQQQGFFGIGSPSAHGAWDLFFDGKGILLVSPVVVAAAAGLVALWRSGERQVAAVCGFATVAFVFVDMGYFDPYGGLSPGPRFFAPALPFLALGLVEAYRRRPFLTGLLALWSISWTTYDNVAWELNVKIILTQFVPNTIFARLPVIHTNLGYQLIFVCAALSAIYGAAALLRARRLALPERALVHPSRARGR